MNDSEFMRQSQAAVERMREMNARSKISENSRHKMPPSPPFVKLNGGTRESNYIPPNPPPAPPPERKENPPPKPSQNNGFGIPILDNLLKDGDSTLILGLLLVLMSENTDKMLLFALVYILL